MKQIISQLRVHISNHVLFFWRVADSFLMGISWQMSHFWVELSYGRRSVNQFVLVSGSTLGPMTRVYPYPFFSDNCFVVLPIGRSLWREDGSVAYIAIKLPSHLRLGSLFVASYDSQGLRRRYSNSPPHGDVAFLWLQLDHNKCFSSLNYLCDYKGI
jgi:hypothetical protein